MFKQIDCQQLLILINSPIIFIDIRRYDDFLINHIDFSNYKINSINIPFAKYRDTSIEPNFISIFNDKFPESQDTTIVIMCYKGISSQSAAQLLCNSGYKNVSNVSGGFDAVCASTNFNLTEGSDSYYKIIS